MTSPNCIFPPTFILPVTDKFPVISVSLSNCIFPVPFGFILISALVLVDAITFELTSNASILITPIPVAANSKLELLKK